MHEGSNIHFSPVDNKPLCSFSNKICRQRRLNGYAFCIRHILEDKSAPFKQCSFVTRSNFQKCLNAIPTNQERGYCHSHMQVSGIIPKTERKTKLSSVSSSTFGKTMVKKSSSYNTCSTSDIDPGSVTAAADSSTASVNGIYDYEDDSLSCPPKLLLKGKSCNVSNGKDNVATATRKCISFKETIAARDTNMFTKNTKNEVDYKNSEDGTLDTKIQQLNDSNTMSHEKSIIMSSQASSKSLDNIKLIFNSSPKAKSSLVLKTKINLPLKIPSRIATESQLGLANVSLVRDKWRTLKFNGTSQTEEDKLKPFHQYEQMKKLKILKKLPLFIDGPLSIYSTQTTPSVFKEAQVSNLETNGSSSVSSTFCIPISKSNIGCDYRNYMKKSAALEILMTPPFLNMNKWSHEHSYEINQSGNGNKSCGLFTDRELGFSVDEIAIKTQEARQHYLCRVRKAFKSQYRTIRHACKISEKHERRHKQAFRNSLLTCVRKNPGLCAKVLVQGNPENSASSNRLAIDTLTNHLRQIATRKLIINELKSCSGSIMSTQLSSNFGYNCQNKPSTLSGFSNEGDSDSKKPFVKLVDNDKKCTVNTVLGCEKAVKHKSAGSSQHTSKVKKKPKFRSKMNGITMPNREAVLTNSNDLETADNLKLEIFDEMSIAKSSTSSKSVKSCILSGILRSTPLTASFCTRKSTNASLESLGSGDDNAHVVVKTEMEDSWDSAIPDKSDYSEDINSPNCSMKNHTHNLHETFSSGNENKIALQTRLKLNQNQVVLCPKLGSTYSYSSDTVAISKGIVVDTLVGSPFGHLATSHRDDCNISDEDVDQNFELQLDPEIAQQASRLLEENELTEDDFNELFPETRMGDQKVARSDLPDLGIDFTSNIDNSDADYSLFANIFPNIARSVQHPSISVNNQF